MEILKELDFRVLDGMIGIQGVANFDNHYGVRVILYSSSYRRESGLYELALTKYGKLFYHDIVNNDVLGNLTLEQVANKMKEIKELENER